jgi:RNA polymerase sigma-70 factor (ECF subfamily)
MKKNFSTYTDKELVKLIKGDKPESDYAFAEIYDRFGLRINAYIRTITGNKQIAEDIFQETFIRFFQKVRSDFERGSLIGFLITIARNLCLNAKRDRIHSISLDDIELPDLNNNSIETKEFSELLAMSLDLLDNEYREPIVLRYFDELRYDEIASIMGITAARARYLVFTGKQKLKHILNPYFEEINK